MDLQPGQNTALAAATLSLDVGVSGMPGGMELDLSAFMLTEAGKVLGDQGMVFYGAPKSSDGAVQLNTATRHFDVDLAKIPTGITRVAFTLTIDKGMSRGQKFSQLAGVTVSARCGSDAHEFKPDVKAMSESALILVEVYQRNGQWKLRAVGQGFNGGLGPLAKHFGVDISDDPDAGAKSQPPSANPPSGSVTPPVAPPPPPAAAPPAPRPVNLTKITLEKAKPISLDKAPSGKYGQIVVNLKWTKGGGLLSKSIDLDLGAFVELNDGFKTVVQALGKSFGSLTSEPYVKLMGDDRTGSSGEGEFLHINGDRWADIKRVLIFAFIYEGVPNWAKANASVTVKMPGQPELEARLDSHSSNQGMCAIATLQNNGGSIQATKHVDYFAGHPDLDQRFGFGFRWKAGSK